jgi:hypothetical protein
MFTKLFLQTTNPTLDWSVFFSVNMMSMVILSILFHIILYTSFANIASYVFLNKPLSNVVNTRMIVCLFFIMLSGYIGRVWHSKQVYKDFDNNREKTREYLYQHYNSWVFIG